jgi:hypothetical protein
MNKNVAKQVVMLSLASSSSLSKVLEFAKSNCSEQDYVRIHSSIGEVSGLIFQLLVRPELVQFPEMESEIDQELGNGEALL